ncbi:MAG: molybdate/tungstate transport system ATP-binding protein [Candidatus Saganbacteria bacterium]|uniref:Molybdate/tungstate transport system ATP-binding protein n=1 Tax=Candidatus Saganbacteria bacterium TaxID=2575572 RepID=A0A833KZV7_UNCSA|nr:MAG: molybdate/tungstate transport system ATP-binding protein [Candidatus Saganbacteria bacterium]
MITALLGPNGAGKSTYLRKLMGIESGKVDLNMAMVFQEPLLFDLTVMENVAMGLRLRKDKDVKNKVDKWLEKLGIKHLALRQATTLSGGEAQKVSLARALALEPKTLLLDEPFANLDLPSQLQFRNDLKKIIIENNIDVVWVTHNISEALSLADYLMIMIDWQIVQEGRPGEVVQKPASKSIASFLGIENIYHGSVSQVEGRSYFKNEKTCFETTALEKSPTWAIVHPEDIILSKEKILGTSARNCLSGIVEEIIPLGLTYKIKINAGEIFNVVITRVSAEEMDISKGKSLYLVFKAMAVQII